MRHLFPIATLVACSVTPPMQDAPSNLPRGTYGTHLEVDYGLTIDEASFVKS